MLVGLLLAGAVTALSLPDLIARLDFYRSDGSDDDETAIDESTADAGMIGPTPPAVEEADTADSPDDDGAQIADDERIVASPPTGLHIVEDFIPGLDQMTLNLPEGTDGFALGSGIDANGNHQPVLSYTLDDGAVELMFNDLDAVPVGDIQIQFDGSRADTGVAVALSDLLTPPEDQGANIAGIAGPTDVIATDLSRATDAVRDGVNGMAPGDTAGDIAPSGGTIPVGPAIEPDPDIAGTGSGGPPAVPGVQVPVDPSLPDVPPPSVEPEGEILFPSDPTLPDIPPPSIEPEGEVLHPSDPTLPDIPPPPAEPGDEVLFPSDPTTPDNPFDPALTPSDPALPEVFGPAVNPQGATLIPGDPISADIASEVADAE